ncbi:ATP-binding protein [Alteromonas sp. 1_MG-2023]|uniref:NACHT domain-containing protein n=1 Tax=Alteromonas sp. 1_MG-2023 TaxID=3062669 RepID=UPI0026E1C217|nr:ATP-binding protein [Alteromonas sp. 1_MG-2023]MDO6475547.1 ATP-binding protein [Alteromonas sp. 1_MG-2023]
MSSTFYLPRTLSSNDETYTEAELLATSNFIVVLAEPGGGKTELMRSLAQKLGTSVVSATMFGYMGENEENAPLIIDAFDELAKVDQTGIHKLLANARKAKPTYVIISSRSSEWGNSSTIAFSDFLGIKPLVVRLCEFDESEQRAIFEEHTQSKDFVEFHAEVARFDLDALLPNPQFLKLFADAYIESGGQFSDKRSIFSQAVDRLAKEVNSGISRGGESLSTSQKVNLSSEVFAKLLLSGAEGISVTEAAESRVHPLLTSLFYNEVSAYGILATRLFKPDSNADQHRPVHKIVAEYCAANYLTKRIASSSDHLTIEKCLPIIAPNSMVRNELRGLLGWMATLGNKGIEEKLIRLDPYAVLANGDPSQLEQSSKRLLIEKLKDIESEDPYFRRGDFRRSFSSMNLFTPEVVEVVRPLLAVSGNGHLRDLLLELLAGSPAIYQFEDELRYLLHESSEDENTRTLAASCLLGTANYDCQADLDYLTSEASQTSLKVAAYVIKTVGLESLERSYLASFFHACSTIYPSYQDRSENPIGGQYFVKHLIKELDLTIVEWLLDELTDGLVCRCGKKYFECSCRDGISKVVGAMLDRYFELATLPFDVARVWKWIGNLNFHAHKSADKSRSVQVLQNDDSLRQGIIACAFEKLTDSNQILMVKADKFSSHAHSGLFFHAKDYRFIIDLAFTTGNTVLWAVFMARHQIYRKRTDRGPDDTRRHMREQACDNPLFMREWAKQNRASKQQFKLDNKKWYSKHNRLTERHARKEAEIRAANLKYVHENRLLIESGQHWSLLIRFAHLVLMAPEKIEEEFGDEALVRSALRNCIDFIAPHVPDLVGAAKLNCASRRHHSVKILFASCLELMRSQGNLESIDCRLLQVLRADIQGNYYSVTEEESDVLKTEIDRLIFSDENSVEVFIRQYIEPQLADSACNHPDVWLLSSDETFSHLRPKLSVEWLRSFPGMALGALVNLFDVAAQFGDRENLKQIIQENCTEFIGYSPSPIGSDDIDKRRTFWFIRALYFFRGPPAACWKWLTADKDNLLLLHQRSGRLYRSDTSFWPNLTSDKVEAILDAFIDRWPKVELPNHWGTGSPPEETAYRFLREVIWLIDSDDPDEAIPVIGKLLADTRYIDLHNDLKAIRTSQIRKKALRNFEPPTHLDVTEQLDHDAVVTVEALRQLVIQELQDYQRAIEGGEYNSADRFYEKNERLGEVRSTEIIAERLSIRFEPKGITVTPEHQLKNANRSDFTVAKILDGSRRLLVTEVKGQWHDELYSAAAAQLHERYSIHPDAEQQGVYLVIWFGSEEVVAGRKKHGISSAQELKVSIEGKVPPELRGLIDVFVLDVSRT